MSIFENVVYPLRIDGQRDRTVLAQVCEKSLRGAALWEEVKDRLNESGLGLSGGQQQRLCIARALPVTQRFYCWTSLVRRSTLGHSEDRGSDRSIASRVYCAHRYA